MGITIVNEADLSQHVQQQGKKAALAQRLLAGQQITLSLQQAAMYSGISENRLTRFVLKESIPYYKLEDGTICFDEGELAGWLKHNRSRAVGKRHNTAALRQQVNDGFMVWEQRQHRGFIGEFKLGEVEGGGYGAAYQRKGRIAGQTNGLCAKPVTRRHNRLKHFAPVRVRTQPNRGQRT